MKIRKTKDGNYYLDSEMVNTVDITITLPAITADSFEYDTNTDRYTAWESTKQIADHQLKNYCELIETNYDSIINARNIRLEAEKPSTIVDPQTYNQLNLLMKLDAIGKADIVIAEMTEKEKMLFTSATALVVGTPEFALVDDFISRAISKNILTQTEVNQILGV